ncbi:MAG: hypothetical protein HDS26_06500 [Bacteroides sp.]|nr:hypothetical protein [Bacteroides sp.]
MSLQYNGRKTMILLSALFCSVPFAVAQKYHPEEPHHHAFHSQEHVAEVAEHEATMREALENNTPVDFQMPGTSRFAFAGRDNKFYLSIGGYAKATASYDFGNPLDNPNEFITSQIPTVSSPGNGGLIQFSAMQTHLCLNFLALPHTADQVGVFVGANFLNDYAPVLQFAYIKYRGFEAGYDYSVFSDPAALPPTIDYEGPNASSAIQTTLLSYTRPFGKKKEWKVGVGAELPVYSVTPGDNAASVSQRVPDIPAFLQYSWGEGASWVRLSGIVRNLLYRDDLLEKNFNKVGWGVQLSGMAAVGPGLTAFYQALYGRGIASHIQDLSDCGLDMTPASAEGRMSLVPAWGGFLGLQYDFSRKVSASMTYSHVRTYADRYDGGETVWGDQYRYAQYAVANLFWNVTDIVQTGIEYIYGRRVNYDGSQGHDNRVQAMIQVNF